MKKDEGFKPFARFSCGKIYDLTANQKSNNSPIGTYKYYDPFKAIFIYTAIYYKFTYGIIDEQLLTERLQDITNRRAEWLASEKECDHCNKKFTGSAVKIKSNKICSTEIEDGGLWGKTSAPTIFCSVPCAEQYCMKLKE